MYRAIKLNALVLSVSHEFFSPSKRNRIHIRVCRSRLTAAGNESLVPVHFQSVNVLLIASYESTIRGPVMIAEVFLLRIQ